MDSLKNKVAIVTGASSGIGYATAKLFAQEGAKVVIGARRKQKLDELVDEIKKEGGEAIALTGDVTNEEYAKSLVKLAISEYSGLDIAFNNAGILGVSASTPDITLEEWNNTINSNLTSAFLGAKYQLPAMVEKGGSLIFTASFVGCKVGMPQMASYSASKAGLVGLTKSLASEYGTNAI